MNYKAISLLAALILAITNCGDDDEQAQPKKTANKGVVSADSSLNFTNDVGPFMVVSCATAGCHSSASAESGFEYETYQGNVAGLGAAIGSIEGGSMPPSGYPEVSQEDLDMLQAWLELGTPE